MSFLTSSGRESSLVQIFCKFCVQLDITHPSVHMTRRFVIQGCPTLSLPPPLSNSCLCPDIMLLLQLFSSLSISIPSFYLSSFSIFFSLLSVKILLQLFIVQYIQSGTGLALIVAKSQVARTNNFTVAHNLKT